MDRPGMKGLRYVTRPKNSWHSVMFVGAGKACTVVNLPWVWLDTIGIIKAAKEIDGLGLHVYFLWIEHQVIFAGNMHKICRQALCSASVRLCTGMSSVIPIHPWHSSRI